MKRIVYVSAFTVLGILLQFIVHAAVEIWYIGLLVEDFSVYGLGLSWRAWFIVHHVGSLIFLAAGIFAGFRGGRYWWKKIYKT